jgi:hypothetical protein
MSLDHDKILIRRNRWDAYMAPLLLAAIAIGLIRAFQTQQWQFVLIPITILPLWLMLRLTTPPEGMRVKTIRSTPGARLLLCLMTATLLMLALAVAIDVYFLGQPFPAPLQAYQAILFAPPLLTLVVAVFWMNRIQRIHRTTPLPIDSESNGKQSSSKKNSLRERQNSKL